MSACAILILFLILTLLITNGSVLRWFFRQRQNETPVPLLQDPPNLRSKFNEYVSRDIRLNRTVNPEYGRSRQQVQVPDVPNVPVQTVQTVQPEAPSQVQNVQSTTPEEPVGASTAPPLASFCNWSEFIDGEPEQELGKQFDLTTAQSACEKESRCEHVSTMKDAKGSDIYIMGYGALKPSTRGMKTSHCTRTKAAVGPVAGQTKTGGRF
jgi:hypothetical protein